MAPGLPPVPRRPSRAALVIAAGLIALAGLIVWNAQTIDASGGYDRIGPTAFPYAIAAGLALLGLATAASAWGRNVPAPEADRIAPIAWVVGGLAVQMALLTLAGFSIATGLMFAATARAFGRGPLWLTIPLGVGFSLVIWLIFAKTLQLALPAGALERFVSGG